MLLLLMGPQGSGKSTQGKLLAEKFNLHFISTGEIFRSLFVEQDPIGIEAHKYWVDGHLVPNELTIQVMTEYFAKHTDKQGFLVDGFPRNLVQYEAISQVFPQPVTALIYLDLKGNVIAERLRKRWHIEHRQDENQAAIARRLAIYDSETHPLVNKFRQDGYVVIEADATPPVEIIFQDVCAKLVAAGITG